MTTSTPPRLPVFRAKGEDVVHHVRNDYYFAQKTGSHFGVVLIGKNRRKCVLLVAKEIYTNSAYHIFTFATYRTHFRRFDTDSYITN